MKYEGVKEWIESKKPEVYDFVEDTQRNLEDNLSNDYRRLETYEKFFIYKYTHENGPIWSNLAGLEEELKRAKEFVKNTEKYQIGDPDSESMLLQKIYGLLWKDLIKKPFMRQGTNQIWMVEAGSDGNVIASDTMTSAMVRFTDAMQAIIITNKTPKTPELQNMCEYRGELINKIRKIYEACGSRQKWWSTNFSIMVVAVLDEMEKKEFSEMIYEQYSAMRRLLDLCHTIGNYCPVPVGFNVNRSGSHAVHDYWDLTLKKIQDWYQAETDESKEKILIKLLHYKKDSKKNKVCRDNCEKWLEWFGKGNDGWRNFVDTLYMQDYVKDYEKGNYDVKLFWEDHDWDNPELTYITEEKERNENLNTITNKRLEEINRRIVARSNRIVDACKEKLGEEKV